MAYHLRAPAALFQKTWAQYPYHKWPVTPAPEESDASHTAQLKCTYPYIDTWDLKKKK